MVLLIWSSGQRLDSTHVATNFSCRAKMIAYLAGHCSGSGLTWVEAIRPPHAETHSLSYLNKFINANRVIRSISDIFFLCQPLAGLEGEGNF